MNALDLYEYDGTMGNKTPQSGSQTPAKSEEAQSAEDPSLNDEVNQVIGQLGRFWGGFRKQVSTSISTNSDFENFLQSVSAFESARKEVGQAVSSAQKELGRRLAETTPQQSTSTEGEVNEKAGDGEGTSTPTPINTSDTTPQPEAVAESSSPIAAKANQLFSRLQASLPPNLAENFQKRLHDAQENPTIQQMRSSVTAGLAKLQEQTKGMSLAQAEEFVQHRSEVLLKETQDFFKEAVKVIPPEDSSAVTETAIWDGSDSWMVTTSESATSQSKKGKGKSGSISFAGNRTAALMEKLRTEANILLLDPASEPNAGVKAVHEKWKADLIASKGVFTSDAWTEDRDTALAGDDGALSALHDKLGGLPRLQVFESFINVHRSSEPFE